MKLVASFDPALISWIESLEKVEYASSVSTVRKKPRRDLSAAQRAVHATSEYGVLYEYTFPDGVVYRENTQIRKSVGEQTVSFLIFEHGSGECWDALEETVWSGKEMETYMTYMNLLSL